MTVRILLFAVLLGPFVDPAVALDAEPPLVYPVVTKHGGVVARPAAQQPPRAGAKVVFDVTADAQPAAVNKGLDRIARLLNLYGVAGLRASDIEVVVVFHGAATRTVLADAAYQRRFHLERNPNLPLLRELQRHGVQAVVCGQALNYKEIADDEVADDVPIVAAAMITIINKQMDGYAYLPVP